MLMTSLPKRMILEVTQRCNYRCPYCYCIWHERPDLVGVELDTQGWLEIIDRCAKASVCELLFTGGEPLMRPDLFKVLAYARAQVPEARLEVYTNGSLLSENVLRRFKLLRVHLSTSLQGLGTYGEMTGTRRTFTKTLEFIGRSVELKWPVAVGMSITSYNLHEACDMVAAAVLSGAGIIQVSPMMAEGRGRERIDLMLSRQKWRRLKMKIKAMPTGSTPIVFCDEMLCDCRRQPSVLRRAYAQRSRKECPAGKSFAVFGPDGRLRRCLHTLD